MARTMGIEKPISVEAPENEVDLSRVFSKAPYQNLFFSEFLNLEKEVVDAHPQTNDGLICTDDSFWTKYYLQEQLVEPVFCV